MFDPQKLLEQFLGGQGGQQQQHGQNAPARSGSGFSPDMLKGLAGGAAAGGLVSILLGSKGGKKLAGSALKVGGVAVNIGARVGGMAGPSEVLVSSTVKDLVAGSGLEFEDRGERDLKGLPDRWHLYRAMP